MKRFLQLNDLLRARLEFEQQTTNPEVFPSYTFDDVAKLSETGFDGAQNVKPFAEGDLVENEDKQKISPDLPAGADLPTFMGMEQAAESYGGTTRESGAKIPINKMQEILAQMAENGLKKGLPQTQIINDMERIKAEFGYTDAMLHPQTASIDDIKDTGGYLNGRPNPFPMLKLSSSILSSIGGTLKGARLGAFAGPLGAVFGGLLGGTAAYVSNLAGYEGLLSYLNGKGLLYTPTYNEYGEFMGQQKGIYRPTLDEQIDYLKREAVIDLAFGGAFMAARPALGVFKATLNKATGVNKEAYQKLKDIGIDPGRSEVSNMFIFNSLPNSIGRTPFFGTVFRKAYEKNLEKYLKNVDKKVIPGFDELVQAMNGQGLAPKSMIADMGYDMATTVSKYTKNAVRDINDNYTKAMGLAESLGDVFSIKGAGNQAREVAKTIFKNAPKKADGSFVNKADESVYSFLKGLETEAGKLGNVNFGKIKGYMNQIDNYMQPDFKLKTSAKDVSQRVKGVLQELEKSLGAPVPSLKSIEGASSPAMREYMNALKIADDTYAKYAVLFGGPDGKHFKGITKFQFFNEFQQQGSKYVEDIFKKAFRLETKTSVENMYKLMGPEKFKDAVRLRIADAFQKSFEGAPGFMRSAKDQTDDFFGTLQDMRFNVNSFKGNLGLDQIMKFDANKLVAMDEALKKAGLGIGVEDLKNFADASQAFFNNKNFNLSTYLARRTQLGGIKSTLRAISGGFLFPGGAAAGAAAVSGSVGLLNAVTFLVLGKYATKIFSNPFSITPIKDAISTQATNIKGIRKNYLELARTLEKLINENPDLEENLENDFNSIQRRINTTIGNFSPLSKGFNDFQKGNNQDLMDFMEGFKDIPDTNVDTPTVPVEESQEPSFRENNVPVPEETAVVKAPVDQGQQQFDRLASVEELFAAPTPSSAESAQALFPQDTLLQASLRKRV